MAIRAALAEVFADELQVGQTTLHYGEVAGPFAEPVPDSPEFALALAAALRDRAARIVEHAEALEGVSRVCPRSRRKAAEAE